MKRFRKTEQLLGDKDDSSNPAWCKYSVFHFGEIRKVRTQSILTESGITLRLSELFDPESNRWARYMIASTSFDVSDRIRLIDML